ncbi:DUF6093 family protein [Streptomyces sp. NPDC090080]|uniref:DUF6093 family protein n=1 Tax=Streptomyces sp. NPDC090080 TaxID=3365939 RepID=UPI0038165656
MADTVQVFRPGPEVLDPDTGVYVPGSEISVYEGSGAVFAVGGPGLVVAVAGQPVPDGPRDRYRLLTPLDDPMASRDDSVRVIAATQDQGLLNRVWRVLDSSGANTLSVVRTTWMDESTQTTGG